MSDIDNDSDNDSDNDNDSGLKNDDGLGSDIDSGLKIDDVLKKEFEGSMDKKNNWKECIYCYKNHPISMHLPDTDYCGHCWGWLNSTQLKLSELEYTGPHTIDEIKNFLKLTYPLHPSNCTNVECIYNKIFLLEKEKKLDMTLCIELE